MKIAIGADYRGFDCKNKIVEYLKSNYEVIDFGTFSGERDDYPLYGFLVGESILKKEADFGIVLCGSAIGVSIACNKVKSIRCGKVNNVEEAIHARENDYVNVIALSANLGVEENIKIIEAFLNAKEKENDPRYLARVKMIEKYEEEKTYDC